MDFNRNHSANSSSRLSSKPEQNLTIQQFNINWDLFRNTLIKKKIPQKSHYWYTLRAERFLTYLAKHSISEITDTHIRKYLQAALNDTRLKEWQIRQVIGSIQILCMDVLDSERFASVPWDDFFMGAQALAPDHPTLAREAVSTDAGKPVYVKPKSGQLAGVAVKYRDELDSFLVELRSRQYSIRTEQSYENWILRFLANHQELPVSQMTVQHVKRFLNDLVIHGNVAASTQNQALNALVFFFREALGCDQFELGELVYSKRQKRLPVVLTRDEARSLLAQLDGGAWLVASLLYGCGLRLTECIRLRVQDLDFGYKLIMVRDGKGGKDRRVPMPERCIEPLQKQLEAARQQHQEDLALGFGEVFLPHALARVSFRSS